MVIRLIFDSHGAAAPCLVFYRPGTALEEHAARPRKRATFTQPVGAPVNRSEYTFSAPLKEFSKLKTVVLYVICTVCAHGGSMIAAAGYAGCWDGFWGL